MRPSCCSTADLAAAVLRLPEAMRAVLRLRRVRGLSNGEAARQLELDETTARDLYGRAMARLVLQLRHIASELPVTLALRAS